MAIKNKIIFFLIFFSLIISALADDADLAFEKYNRAQNEINDLQRQGYPTKPIIDLLNDAETQYNNKNYNLSKEISEKVILEAGSIRALKSNLENFTQKINILQYYMDDTTEISIQLLYAKSDFESANIDLSKRETKELDDKIYFKFFNISRSEYAKLQDFKTKNDEKNISFPVFEKYFKKQTEIYQNYDFYSFLYRQMDFETIKRIIAYQESLNENSAVIEKENISFRRMNDTLNFFYLSLAEENYNKSEKTIADLDNLAKTAIRVKDKMNELNANYNRLNDLGLIDNKTTESYNSVSTEFYLENFQKSEDNLESTKKLLSDIETRNIIFGGLQRAKLKKDLTSFLKENWKLLLIIALILITLYFPSKNYILLKYSRNKYEKLKFEKETIGELQKELQTQYYIEHFIDKKTYHDSFYNFEEKKVEIGNRITFYEEKEKAYINYFENIKKITLIFKKKA